MGRAVDINSDPGQSFGAYTIGDDAAMMPVITSDTACFHGDTPGAAQLVRAARDALTRAGVETAPLGRWLS